MNDELEQPVPVNAGGRTMRGFLPGIRFETDPGAGGGGEEPAAPDAAAGADPEPAAPADVAGVVGEEPSPEPAAPTDAPGVDWDNIENLREAAARLQELGYTIEQAPPAAAPEPEAGFDWGSLDAVDDNFGANLKQGILELLQATLGPTIGPVVQDWESQRATQWSNGQLETLKVPDEDRDYSLYVAGGVQKALEAAGTQASGEQILSHAVEQIRARDKRIGDVAVEAYKASLNGLEDVPLTPGGVPAGDGTGGDDVDELAAARRLVTLRSA